MTEAEQPKSFTSDCKSEFEVEQSGNRFKDLALDYYHQAQGTPNLLERLALLKLSAISLRKSGYNLEDLGIVPNDVHNVISTPHQEIFVTAYLQGLKKEIEDEFTSNSPAEATQPVQLHRQD